MKVLREKGVTLADLLPAGRLEALCATGRRRRFNDGQLIQNRGHSWDGMTIVNAGAVIVGNTGEDGSFLTSAILRPGECFGEFTAFLGIPMSHGLWAQGETQLTAISRKRFMQQFERDPVLSQALLKLSLMRNYEMLDFLDAQRRLSLASRIARLLLTEVNADPNTRAVECRHEDLAYMLGVSRVAVGKALKQLVDAQLITLGYGQIHLGSIEGLKARIAAEDQFLPLADASVAFAKLKGSA